MTEATRTDVARVVIVDDDRAIVGCWSAHWRSQT